jgi:hypothetical protein
MILAPLIICFCFGGQHPGGRISTCRGKYTGGAGKFETFPVYLTVIVSKSLLIQDNTLPPICQVQVRVDRSISAFLDILFIFPEIFPTKIPVFLVGLPRGLFTYSL